MRSFSERMNKIGQFRLGMTGLSYSMVYDVIYIGGHGAAQAATQNLTSHPLHD